MPVSGEKPTMGNVPERNWTNPEKDQIHAMLNPANFAIQQP
jgi:hypothetical protein